MTSNPRFILILSLAQASPLFGLGIRIADQDATATARGNAFAATVDNPSAIFYNPAGISQLPSHQFRAGAYGLSLDSTFRPSGGDKFDTRDEFLGIGSFYYTYGLENLPLSLGVGVYSPYGLGLEWPESSPFRSLAIEGRLLYATLNPVLAWRIHPAFSVAAGVTLNYSDVELRRGIFVPGDEFKFEGDDTDVGFNLGILWQPHLQHSFGVSYRSATTMEFDGRARTRLIQPFAFRGSESGRARFHFPQHLIVGWSFRPTPDWNVEFNADWTDWDSLDTVNLIQESRTDALPFNWESSFFYEFGVTRYFKNGFLASAGYIFSENSVPERSFNPIVPDSDRHVFSVGVGQKLKQLRWDAAYQFAYGPSRSINNGTPASGRYTFTSHAFAVSLGYTF